MVTELIEELLADPASFGLTLALSQQILVLTGEEDEALSEYLLGIALPPLVTEVLGLAVTRFRVRQPVKIGHPYEKKIDAVILGEDRDGRPDWVGVSLSGPLWPSMDMARGSDRAVPAQLIHTVEEAARLEQQQAPLPHNGKAVAAATPVGQRAWVGEGKYRPKAQAQIRRRGGGVVDIELRDAWRGDPPGARIFNIPMTWLWTDEEVEYYKPYVIEYEEGEHRGFQLDPRLEEIDGFWVFPGKEAPEIVDLFRDLSTSVAPLAAKFFIDQDGPDGPLVPPEFEHYDTCRGPGFKGVLAEVRQHELNVDEHLGFCTYDGKIAIKVHNPHFGEFRLGRIEPKYYPRNVIMETLIHEMTHLREKSHDPNFWRLFCALKAEAIKMGILRTDEPSVADYFTDPAHHCAGLTKPWPATPPDLAGVVVGGVRVGEGHMTIEDWLRSEGIDLGPAPGKRGGEFDPGGLDEPRCRAPGCGEEEDKV